MENRALMAALAKTANATAKTVRKDLEDPTACLGSLETMESLVSPEFRALQASRAHLDLPDLLVSPESASTELQEHPERRALEACQRRHCRAKRHLFSRRLAKWHLSRPSCAAEALHLASNP